MMGAHEQIHAAIAEAMHGRRAFSWTKGENKGDVQEGVYVSLTQSFYWKYRLK